MNISDSGDDLKLSPDQVQQQKRFNQMLERHLQKRHEKEEVAESSDDDESVHNDAAIARIVEISSNFPNHAPALARATAQAAVTSPARAKLSPHSSKAKDQCNTDDQRRSSFGTQLVNVGKRIRKSSDSMLAKLTSNAKKILPKRSKKVIAVPNWLSTLCQLSHQWKHIVEFEERGKFSGKAIPFSTYAPTPKSVQVVIVMNYPSTSPICYPRMMKEDYGYLYPGENGLPSQRSWREPVKVMIRLLESRNYSFDEAKQIVLHGTICINRQPISGVPDWCKDRNKSSDYHNMCFHTDPYTKKLFSEIFEYILESKNEAGGGEVVVEKEEVAELQVKKLDVAVMGKNPHMACVEGGGALNSSWFPEALTNVQQSGSLPHGSQLKLLNKGQRDSLLFTMEQLTSSLVNAKPRDLSTRTDNWKDSILPYSKGKFQNWIVNNRGEFIEVDVEEAEDVEGLTIQEGNLEIEVATFKCDKCGITKTTEFNKRHFDCGFFNHIKVIEPGGATKWIKWIVRGYCRHCPSTGRLNTGNHLCKGRGGRMTNCLSVFARPEDVDREEPPSRTRFLWIKTVDGKVVQTFEGTQNMEKDFSEKYEELKSQNPDFVTNDPHIQGIVKYKSGGKKRQTALSSVSGPLQNGIVRLGNIKYHGVPILYNNKNPPAPVVAVDEKLPAIAKNTTTIDKETMQPSILKTLKQMPPTVAKKPPAVAKRPPAIAKKPPTVSTTSATKSEKPTQRCACSKGDCTSGKCACRKAGKPCGAHCDCKNCHNGSSRKKDIKSFFLKKS